MTQVAQTTLKDLVKLLPRGANGEAAARIKYAYTFIEKAHGNYRCETGLLHLEHNLAIARIMVELGTDVNTITASMLHDIFEPHTGVSKTAVIDAFDEEVIELVHILQNLYEYTQEDQYLLSQNPNVTSKQLEEIRGAILSISKGDIRVLLIMMADNLQNLRHANELPPDRQLAIASEGMNIYAPLANRLGIWQLKWELEDLSFRYLEPEQYKDIAKKLADRRVDRNKKIKQAVNQLSRKIKQNGIKASISGRPKHIYSIYRKMKRKDLDFEHIYDIQAVRVILEPNPNQQSGKSNKQIQEDERSLCYQVLGIVHGLWQPIPREFDDYIAAPKANGYKSLHTAVIDPETRQTLEVQIRTLRMHEEAEKGVAAHWAYKEEGSGHVSASIQRRIQTLRELLGIMQRPEKKNTEEELLETGAMERIYVFTPKGKVVDLPAGATPIDFAYQIHTEVGHRSRGARVNGKMVSLDYELQSGDRVEIITGNRPGPSRDWMNPSLGYTTSARTRSKIRQWFRTQEREQNIEQGRDVVEREIKRLGLTDTHKVEDIALALKFDDEDEFLAKVGFGDIQSAQITGAITRLQGSLKPDDDLLPLLIPANRPRSKGLTVRGVSGLHTRVAKCCNPIPPEPIIGYITRGQGVTVHSQSCQEIARLSEKEPERLIDVSWGEEAETYPIPIIVEAYRRPRLIDDVQNVLRGQQIPTPKTKTLSSEDGMSAIYLIVEVVSLEQLNWLLNKLENLPNVTSAKRQRWS